MFDQKEEKTFMETRTITIEEITTPKKPYKNGLEYDEVKKLKKIVKEYDNGKEKKVIEDIIGSPIKRFWKNYTNEIKYDEKVGDITYHKIKMEKRQYETDDNGIKKNKEDKGKLIDENVDIISYTVKEVTINNYTRNMSFKEISNEFPELARTIVIRSRIVNFFINLLISYKIKITEIIEYEKTYDYKTNKILNSEKVSNKNIPEIL